MKRLFLVGLMLVVFMTASFSEVTRTGIIRTGGNILNKMTFTAADTVVTSDTLSITITNIQKYMQHFTATYTLDSLSGDPSIGVTLYGKTTVNGSWTSIGTATWDDQSDNPQSISSTAPANYNWLKLEFIASATVQESQLLTVDVRTSNAFDVPSNAGTVTFSRGTAGTVTLTSKDNDANAALTVAAGGTGALTIGDANSTTAITSSDWAIGATGIMTGIGAITADGLITANAGVTLGADDDLIGSATSDITFNTNMFTVAGATGNTSVGGTLGVTGVSTFTGGFTYTGVSPVVWAKGGSTVLATSGTDVACANGTRFWVEVDIPYNVTLTGIAYLVGSVGGTDSVVVQLHNSAGVQVATSRAVGGAAAIVGTAAQFQSCAFTSTYAAVAGKYYASVQFNGTTAKFRAYPIPGSKFITGTAAGTWGTAANITPGTTFTADKGPILMTY